MPKSLYMILTSKMVECLELMIWQRIGPCKKQNLISTGVSITKNKRAHTAKVWTSSLAYKEKGNDSDHSEHYNI